MLNLLKITLILLITGSVSAHASTTPLPKFTDYPVEIYTGKKAPVDYRTDPSMKMFKTRINTAYNEQKPDFAGRYSLVGWGCSTACSITIMVNRATGTIYPLEVLADNATKNASKSCQQIPRAEGENPIGFVTRPTSLLAVGQQYCKSTENGKSIMLNNYLLWQEKTKTFKLLNQAFTTE